MPNQKPQAPEQIWHNDGHEVHLRINRADMEIVLVSCPHESEGECKNKLGECSVSAFIMRYGMDCNAGMCEAHTPMKICWTLIGDKDSLDECQVWFMPTADHVFSAWLDSTKDLN